MIVACDCPSLQASSAQVQAHVSGWPPYGSISCLQGLLSINTATSPTTTDQVLAIKEAGCSQIVEEERKIGDLVGKLSRMDLEGLSRDELMRLETRVVSLRRQLYDVVHSRPLYAPQR